MSTGWPRTAFCVPICRPGCASTIRSGALAEIAKRVGRKVMKGIAQVAQPDTILGWYRRLVAAKFDGSAGRTYPGRPQISAEVEALVVRFARESWLGLRPDRGYIGESGPSDVLSNGGEHPTPAQPRAGDGASTDNHLKSSSDPTCRCWRARISSPSRF